MPEGKGIFNSSQGDGCRTVSSTELFGSSFNSLQTRSSIGQPLIISNCVRKRASLSFGSIHVFRVCLSVAMASVYNVTCFDLTAQFQDDPETVQISLPLTFVSVTDKRASVKKQITVP